MHRALFTDVKRKSAVVSRLVQVRPPRSRHWTRTLAGLGGHSPEKVQAFRIATESSWLNWTRNAIIASVSGIALYSGTEVKTYEDLLPSKLMMGAGLVFCASGTVQYAMTCLAFEGSASMLLWNLGNAGVVLGLYSGAVYLFLKRCETKLELANPDTNKSASSKDGSIMLFDRDSNESRLNKAYSLGEGRKPSVH